MTLDEKKFDLDQLTRPVIGVDEVGRGCLAGPVCAGAVILSHTKIQYKDSKSLTAKQRELYHKEIQEIHQTAIGQASVEEIDEMNILNASLLAMKRAVLSLGLIEGTVIVDGSFLIPDLDKSFKQIAVIKADSKISCVAAASILAKHYRDTHLKALATQYPGYGFEKHKGYASVMHKQAIRNLGPCPQHRKTFSGVKEFC